MSETMAAVRALSRVRGTATSDESPTVSRVSSLMKRPNNSYARILPCSELPFLRNPWAPAFLQFLSHKGILLANGRENPVSERSYVIEVVQKGKVVVKPDTTSDWSLTFMDVVAPKGAVVLFVSDVSQLCSLSADSAG